MNQIDINAIILAGGAGSRLGGVDKALLEHDGETLLARLVTALAPRVSQIVIVGHPRDLRVETDASIIWTLEDPPGGGPLAGLEAGVRVLLDPSTKSARGISAEGTSDSESWFFAFACDQPFADRAIHPLLRAASGLAPSLGSGVALSPSSGAARSLGPSPGSASRLKSGTVPSPNFGSAPAPSSGKAPNPGPGSAPNEVVPTEGIIGVDHTGRFQALTAIYRLDAVTRVLAELGPTAGLPMRALTKKLDLVTTELPLGASQDVDTPADIKALGIARPL